MTLESVAGLLEDPYCSAHLGMGSLVPKSLKAFLRVGSRVQPHSQ